MEVCIIGGGFSGIISAKYCKDEGLVPFVLEKSRSPGGIWRGYADEVGVWESMHTNNSKYSLTFSDHPWNPLSEEYPSWQEVGEYLNSYITKHNLQDYFHLNCKVTKVKNIQDQYLVKWDNNGCLNQKIFDYVIIAAGLFVQTNTPLENSEIFQGQWLHSSSYRNPSIFSNKKVVCIGKNFSASDISYEALKTALSVTQVFKKSTLMINKYINTLPCELLTMTLSSILSCKTLFPSVSELLKIKQDIINLCGNPGNLHPLWKMNEQEPGSIYAVYADDKYINAIVSNKILLEQGKAKSFYSDGVVLENGKHIEADVVVLATGYHRAYEFLSKNIKRIVKYDSGKPGLSMSLFRSIFHPDLPKLCFVGNIIQYNLCFEGVKPLFLIE